MILFDRINRLNWNDEGSLSVLLFFQMTNESCEFDDCKTTKQHDYQQCMQSVHMNISILHSLWSLKKSRHFAGKPNELELKQRVLTSSNIACYCCRLLYVILLNRLDDIFYVFFLCLLWLFKWFLNWRDWLSGRPHTWEAVFERDDRQTHIKITQEDQKQCTFLQGNFFSSLISLLGVSSKDIRNRRDLSRINITIPHKWTWWSPLKHTWCHRWTKRIKTYTRSSSSSSWSTPP